MKNPKVEVIILNYNQKQLTYDCIESVLKTEYDNYRITLVDNGSSDGSFDFLKKRFGNRISIMKNKGNLGFAEGNNAAMRKSKADYVCLLNNDTTVDKNWLKHLVNFMEENKEVGICQPKVLSMKEPNKFEYAGASGGFMDIFGYPLCRGRVFDSIEDDNGQYEDSHQIFWACGVAMFIRNDVLKKIGYFDKDFFMYAEELDLDWRANLAGYKVYVVPKSRIFHLGRGTSGKTKKSSQQSIYLIHRNHILIILKNYSRSTLLKILPGKLFLEGISFFYFLIKKPWEAYGTIKGLGWVLLNFNKMIKKNREIEKIRKIPDKEVMNSMIKTSVALQYFINKKESFKDYTRYLWR